MPRFKASHSPSTPNRLSRRGFLGTALAGLPAAALLGQEKTAPTPAPSPTGTTKIKEYRTLGRTGFKVSDVSFGAGPLNNANVLASALERGMNYIDTAEHYENGNSERTIGQVFKTRDRKSVFLTTKLNLTFNKKISKTEIRERFMKSLERMGTDHAECLMIHMCTLAQVKYEPYHELIAELKAEGKVRFSGLSNHGADNSLSGRLDEPCETVVQAAAEDGRFDVVLGVFNFLKEEQGQKIFKACASKNMGLTLMKMNPGMTTSDERIMLARLRERYKNQNKEFPEALTNLAKITEDRGAAVEAFLKKYGLQGPEQAREAAIKFCLNRPEVHCVCPSINSFEDLDAYIGLSGMRFTAHEAAMLAAGRETYGDLTCRIGCTECQGACPRGIPVNSIMRYEYYFNTQGREKAAMAEYAGLGGRNAADCADCPGPCEAACPHGVPIQGKLLLAHDRLTPA
jgi:predicted aldo/keto reductase-like oxidoreductase